MDRRREMARRLRPVLLVVVVIMALVGLFAGDGFCEEDTLVGGEKTEGEQAGKPLWRDVVDVVSALAVIVIGVATVWTMIAQKKQSKQQARWQREFAEGQERWQKKVAERQQWMEEGERKLEAVKGVGLFYEKLAKGRRIKWWDVQELILTVIPKGLSMFKGKRRRFLQEVGVKAKEWWEMEKRLEEGGNREEGERRRKELTRWFELSGEEMGELTAACWGEEEEG